MDPEDLRPINYVNADEVWEHEEHDFTPWIVENINQLANSIGIELEDPQREESVGDYKADIIATEVNTDSKVVIENQFGTTNHNHLGKLLTYSAGNNAEFVIWIAEEFRAEHRSVLDWLNSGGPTGSKFFGIQPAVIRWGDDNGGFEFRVVVEPNDWERELQKPLTPRKQAQKEFYSDLSHAYSEANPEWNRLKAQPQSWLSFSAGTTGINIGWSFHQGPEFSVELYLDVGDKNENAEIFRQLMEEKTEIEEKLGELVWQELPDSRACRIKLTRNIESQVEELSSIQRESIIEWGVENMDAFRAEFEPRISEL